MRIVAAFLAAALCAAVGTGCIPGRDNPRDPAIVPRARIVITVDEEPTAIGARRDAWILDGSTSSDPDDSIVSWTWSITTSAEATAATEDGWLEFSSNAVASTELTLELAGIHDFSPDPGLQPVGTTSRVVRLVVRDHDGHKGTAFAPIVVYNTPPTVDLGGDRRIAPGGQWWNVVSDGDGNGVVDTNDAAPHQVTLYANVADPDPGETQTLGAANIRWRVSGLLAETLDADIDGFVDDDRFVDPEHRALRFDAPLFPARSRIVVQVSDAIDDDGNLIAPAEDSLEVDVASTRWVADSATGTVARLQTSSFSAPQGPSMPSTLASAGGRFLTGFDSGSGMGVIAVNAQTLRPYPAVLPLTRTIDVTKMHATGDGAGGWWVLDQEFGELHHLGPDIENDPAVRFTDLDGNLTTDDLIGAESLAAVPGSTDVWVAGGDPAGSTLFLVGTAGLQTTIPLGSNDAQVAIDPRGGGWVLTLGTGITRLTRFEPDGTLSVEDLTPSLPAPAIRPDSIAYDYRNDLVWGSYNSGAGKCLFRRDARGLAGGGFFAKCGFPTGRVNAFPVDSTMVTTVYDGFLNALGRYDVNLDLVSVVPLGELGVSSFSIMEGGTAVVDLFDADSLTASRMWIEGPADASTPPNHFVSGLNPLSMAVDPLGGAVWAWDFACECLVEVRPDGSALRSIDLGVTGATDGYAAIDPQTRRMWIGWNSPSGAGLSYVDLTDDPSVALTATTTAFTGPDGISDVDVVPGGQVCIAGSIDADTTPIAIGWAYRPAANETAVVETDDASSVPAITKSDARTGGCWFLPSPSEPAPLAHSGFIGPSGTATVTPSNELDSGGGEKRVIRGGAKDYFTESNPTRFWILNEQSQSGFPTRVFSFYDFAINTQFTIGGPSFTFQEPGPFDEVASLDFDQYYRQFYVGIGDPTLLPSVPGRVIRIDATISFAEIGRYEGFYGAVVAGTP